ncbi:MAG: DUF378 domain-containing protein [Christensenellaceae bacterium]|nr:DUF378 domain-containing protein [Christensenellaceae bacterium]
MTKKKIMKWVNMTAFGFMLLGGFNFLLMGLFKFDLFAAMFGGNESVTSRVFYGIFGVSAMILLTHILWKAFMTKKPAVAPKTANKAA